MNNAFGMERATALRPEPSPSGSYPVARPVEPWERPYLQALGAELRRLRHRAGLSQRALERRAGYGVGLVCGIEAGSRRTRASTIRALVEMLHQAGLAGNVDATVARLVELAGPCLAAESRHPRPRAPREAVQRWRWPRLPPARRPQRERALARQIQVAELLLAAVPAGTQTAIAHKLGVGKTTVSRDVAAIAERLCTPAGFCPRCAPRWLVRLADRR